MIYIHVSTYITYIVVTFNSDSEYSWHESRASCDYVHVSEY